MLIKLEHRDEMICIRLQPLRNLLARLLLLLIRKITTHMFRVSF